MGMNDKGYKCIYCPNCPYYEKVTSYGTERVECGNTDCIHHGANYTEVKADE